MHKPAKTKISEKNVKKFVTNCLTRSVLSFTFLNNSEVFELIKIKYFSFKYFEINNLDNLLWRLNEYLKKKK